MAVHRGDQRSGQGWTGGADLCAGDIASTGTFAVPHLLPIGFGTMGQREVGGTHRTSGDLIPERWATSSPNGRRVHKNRAPAVAVRPGLLHVAQGVGGWRSATLEALIGQGTHHYQIKSRLSGERDHLPTGSSEGRSGTRGNRRWQGSSVV